MTSHFFIFSRTILHPITREYINVLCCDSMPSGPLSTRTSLINPQRLSEFQHNYQSQCIYVINQENSNNYMLSKSLPELFTYFVKNNYVIQHDITQYLKNNHTPDNCKYICMLSYSE